MRWRPGKAVNGTAHVLALGAMLWLAAPGSIGAEIDLARLPTQFLAAATAPLLKTEPVGIASVQTWVDQVALFQTPGSDAWRVLLAKKETRDARRFSLTTIDLGTGALTNLQELAGYGVSKFAWSGGKMFFGTWLPGGFYVYDPASNVVTSLGRPFDNPDTGPYKMAVSPDGVVALGAGGGPVELATFDPGSGTLTRYGALSDRHTFVYELGSDDRYVYAGLRGKAPWELVAVNKKTRERKVLFTVPLDGYINIRPGAATAKDKFSDTNETWRTYDLKDGQAILRDPAAPIPAAPTPASPPPVPPQLIIDDSPLLEGKTEVLVHYQDPLVRTNWNRVRVPAPVASELTLALTALDDGRLAALAGPYNPALVFDPQTGEGRQAPFRALSGRCMAAVGPVIYASGYPSTVLVRWDTSKPLTDRIDLPGKTFIPDTSPAANPRTCGTWLMGPSSGGHMGVRLFKGPGNTIFICTARHRYARGYDVVWYDPATDTQGEIEDQGLNDHRAITWASPLEEGRKLIIATTVEPNDQLKSPVPDSGNLIVVDLAARHYVTNVAPFPGLKALTGIVEVAPNRVVGLALANDNASTFIYRYDLAAKKVEQVVRVAGVLFGTHGTTALPGKGLDFVLGPDHRIWTGMTTSVGMSAVVLIDPNDLSISIPGRIASTQFRYTFVNGEVYINGDVRIRRLPELSSTARK